MRAARSPVPGSCVRVFPTAWIATYRTESPPFLLARHSWANLSLRSGSLQNPAAHQPRRNLVRLCFALARSPLAKAARLMDRSEEHTSELQSRGHLVCRLLLEKKKTRTNKADSYITICSLVTEVYRDTLP